MENKITIGVKSAKKMVSELHTITHSLRMMEMKFMDEYDYNEAYRLRDHRIYLDSLCNQFSAVLVADAVGHAEGNNAINK